MFSKFFINRPIFSTVISLLISLAGIVSITMLPIEQYPDLTPPTVAVTASYPGASPEVIANTVAAPIEQQVNGVEDMLYMNSTSSSNGDMNLTVSFKVGTDPDQAMINVNNRVQGATATLPEDVRRYGIQVNKKSSAILQLIALYSPNGYSDTTTIGNYALLNIVDDLKRIEGVGDAQVMSANDYSIRIWIKPDVLSQRGLSVSDLVAAVQAQNAQRAAGKIGQPPLPVKVDRTYAIIAPGRLTDPKEFEEIILRANPDGTSLRLKDVARVELGSQTYEFNGSFNGKPAVPVGVYLSPGANAVATAKAVDAHMKELAQTFPPDLDIAYTVAYDTTLFVSASIEEVIHTLIEAMILVFLVVYLFLKDWRATLIPCLAVPVSIIGAFAGMLLLGFSINTLTLFGLVLAIGMVVDDAIVVIENVERIMHDEDLPVKEATIKAMDEVSGPVVAIVLVLCSVFVPVAFMGGLTGVMYQQFAITIAVSVVISGLVALTLTPALCALLLKKQPHPTKGFFYQFDRFFEKITKKYGSWVAFFIRRLSVSGILIGLLFLATFGLFKVVPGSLLPEEDQGIIMVAAQLDPSASLANSDAVAKQLEEIVLAQPAVSQELTFAGFDLLSSTQKSNAVSTFVALKPWKERKGKGMSSTDVVGKIYAESLFKVPGAVVMPFNPPPIMGMSTTGGLEGYIQNRGSGGSAALQAMSGPAGGFFFAPQFDASFLRILQQSGYADIRNTANLTVSNSDSKSYELLFNPQLQNIEKTDNDKTSVTLSAISSLPEGANQVYLKIINPVVNLHGGIPQAGYPANEAFSLGSYTPGDYAKRDGTLFFGYNVQTASVVERNNTGSELIETGTMQGNTLIELKREVILAQWDKDQEVEQTIGMPFLAEIPVLKYLFSTTTTSREKTRFYMTVRAEMLNTAPGMNELEPGALKKIK